MMRYTFNADDRAKSAQVRQSKEARAMRREAELVLLNKLYAELAMGEWYPER